MKAIVYTTYGLPDVLQLKEVDKPSPKNKEVLIKVMATAVNSADWRLRKADPFAVRLFFGLRKPRKIILGGVLSGVIEDVGKDVKEFKVGDAVYGSAGLGFGAYAEYLCLPEDAVLAIKPTNLSHEEAAVIPFGGSTALQFLKKAGIKSGQRVLIYGASGSVGTAAVQIAKHLGAHVTGVCSNINFGMVKSLGADKVIDYNATDFIQQLEKYDVLFETVNKLSVSQCVKLLNHSGTLILGAAGLSQMLQGLWAARIGGKRVFSGLITENLNDMRILTRLVEDGQLKAVIDRTYFLRQMAEAHTYVEKGHKKGNVAVSLSDN